MYCQRRCLEQLPFPLALPKILQSTAIASIAALGPPLLMHLDLSRNSIIDSGLAGLVSAAQQQQQQQHQLPGGPLLPHLAVLDLSYNRVAAEAAVTPLLQRLPGLQRLLLAGNPLVRYLLRTQTNWLHVLDKWTLPHVLHFGYHSTTLLRVATFPCTGQEDANALRLDPFNHISGNPFTMIAGRGGLPRSVQVR